MPRTVRPDAHILCVDDNAAVRMLLRASLNNLGYRHVDVAENVPEALARLDDDNDYDLIISDLHMPEKNGIEFLEEVRGNESFAKIPFIMLTSDCGKDKVVSAIHAGVNGYLVKPFSPKAIQASLAKVFNGEA